MSKIRTRFDLPQLVRSVPSSSTGQHNYCPKTIHSAPSKLSESSSKSTLPSGWKFVNKYQNRSNGGIPIYSEERLQERKEKVRRLRMKIVQTFFFKLKNLQSTSSVLSSSFYQPEIHSKVKMKLCFSILFVNCKCRCHNSGKQRNLPGQDNWNQSKKLIGKYLLTFNILDWKGLPKEGISST